MPIRFLHRADIASGEVQLVETEISQLRQATFLDGREQFWSSAKVESCAFNTPTTVAPAHFLFHFGFCGSTLLAKMLDRPGTLLTLKEPQSLADIASQKPLLDKQARELDVSRGLAHTLDKLRCIFPDEPVLIKPSSWINGLLPLLSRARNRGRAIFLTIDRRDYLRTTFRGGRDRLAHCSRFASLIAHELVDGGQILQQAIAANDDPLDRAAHIMAFVHASQVALFDDATTHGDWRQIVRIDYADIAANPLAVLRQSAVALGIEPERWANQQVPTSHAKDERQKFSHKKREAEHQEVERHHARRFDEAMRWIESVSLKVRLPANV